MTKREIIGQHKANRKFSMTTFHSTLSDAELIKLRNLECTKRDMLNSRRVEDVDIFDDEELYASLHPWYKQEWVTGDVTINGLKLLRPRVANLAATKDVLWHIDSPEALRVLVMLQGSQIFTVDDGKGKLTEQPMLEGEVWLVNPSFMHTITNTSDGSRIALLGDCPQLKEM